MTSLDDYLAAQMGRRWRWGEVDCVQFGLGWARERTGRPLSAFWSYQSREDAERLLRGAGGLGEVVGRWMRDNGFAATAAPDDGDVGLAPVPPGALGAVAPVAVVIRRGPWWMTREIRGVGGLHFEAIPAWRIA